MTDSSSPRSLSFKLRLGLIAGIMLVVASLLLLDTWRSGLFVDLPNAAHSKLDCASYTPSHNGRMRDEATKRALVKSDLGQLARRFRCVRTYSVSEGLDDVPSVAQELGLEVMLGLWISMDGPSNDREIARGLELANKYPGTVKAIIVGNEVLLRREQTAPQLASLIARVRSGTRIPVTYADVWEFWLRNPQLVAEVNFITIHILPYWEDDPIDIDRALAHVQSIYKKVQNTYAQSEIFIGETGWPSAGRPRLNAVPSPINQARFLREFIAYAERERIHYNLIEAYDQPWKRNQEGTVGGYWGLYDAQGAQKFAFVGPIVADPKWHIAIIASLIGAVCFALAGWLLKPRPSIRSLAFIAIVGHATGSLLYKQWQYMSTANRSPLEWFSTGGWSLVGLFAVALSTVALARWMDGAALLRPPGIAEFTHGLGHGADRTGWLSRALGVLRFIFLFGLAYVCLGLTYEGRGRDFPIVVAALPVLLFLFTEVAAHSERRAAQREELLLAVVLIFTCGYIAFHETVANTRAILWCALCLTMSCILFASRWRSLNPDERSQKQPESA